MLAVPGGDVHGGIMKPLLDDGRRVAARDQVARIRPHKILDNLEIACMEKRTDEIEGEGGQRRNVGDGRSRRIKSCF